MDSKGLVPIVKKMLSIGLDSSEKKALSEEKPVERLLLKQWDKLAGTSMKQKDEEEVWQSVKAKCWNEQGTFRTSRTRNLIRMFSVAAACLIIFIGGWAIVNYMAPLKMVVVSPVDQRTAYILPDSSVVWLTVGSKLSYREDYLKERNVYLEGEGDFDVMKKDGLPFCVHFNDAIVEVKGTEFNIKSSNRIAEVTLYTGKIEFQIKGREAIVMKPSERVLYDISTKKVDCETLDIEGYDWRAEEYRYSDKPLSELINFINHNYHTTVCVENIEQEDYLFTGSIRKNEDLKSVLRKICICFELKMDERQDSIVLY